MRKIWLGGPVALLAIIGVAGALTPDPVPSWQPASSLVAPRTYAQAVALATGDVLLMGGMDRAVEGLTRDRAEVFDPRTGRSTLVPSPRAGRLWATLTTLRNDVVLVVGGVARDGAQWDALPLADAFDPWSKTWLRVAQPRIPRSDHGATLLADGRVLVAGGHDGPRFVREVEAYDPTTNAWRALAPLPKGRTQFSIATLPDGRVLVAGGFEEPGEATDTSLLYDPRADRWRAGPKLAMARAIHSTVQLANGDVLLIGGQRGAAGTAERYDARVGRFEFAGTLVEPRMFGQATLADDGGVILVGGFLRPTSGPGYVPTSLAERWDPRSARWSAIPSSLAARAAAGIVAVDGGVYLLGGSTEGDEALSTIELFRY